MAQLSVVVPLQGEREHLAPLHAALVQALGPLGLEYEILFVDDGSTDGSDQVLRRLAAADPRVKVLSLRRNFGQTPALQAGIDWSQGEIVVTMDGDLQNDPADIPLLLAKLGEGYDAVLGWRKDRKDGALLRKLPSRIANWLIRKVTRVEILDMGCTLRALRREVALALPLYGEMHRFIPVLAQQTGARLAQIPVRHHPRVAGQTKYTLSRTFRVVLDLITVKFLHSYVTRPMHVFGGVGLASMVAGFLSLLATVWMKLARDVDMTGNPLLLLSVLLGMVGVQFISIGLIGEMLTRTYHESQGKSSYLVRSTLNLDPPAEREAA